MRKLLIALVVSTLVGCGGSDGDTVTAPIDPNLPPSDNCNYAYIDGVKYDLVTQGAVDNLGVELTERGYYLNNIYVLHAPFCDSGNGIFEYKYSEVIKQVDGTKLESVHEHGLLHRVGEPARILYARGGIDWQEWFDKGTKLKRKKIASSIGGVTYDCSYPVGNITDKGCSNEYALDQLYLGW